MGNTIVKNTSKIQQPGRWMLKSKNQVAITSYWSNIDHCGDTLCGNTVKAKKFLNKQISQDYKPIKKNNIKY